MVTSMGREKPQQAVEDFVGFLNQRMLADAYWLLTSPERDAVPIVVWLSERWNSPDDELVGRVIRVRTLEVTRTSPKGAVVEVALDLDSDPSERKTNYATRLEANRWYVYLGLDRRPGVWTVQQPS